jgi:hypothetical protein
MKKENIKKFKALINNKIKKINNIQNKKVHIKRNFLYTKRNIISSIPLPFTSFNHVSPTPETITTSISHSTISKQSNNHSYETGLLNKYIIFRIKNNKSQDFISSNSISNTIRSISWLINNNIKFNIPTRLGLPDSQLSDLNKERKIPLTKCTELSNKLGIKIKVKEKLYKEFEKEIKKIAKIYNLKVFFIYHPFKSTTKKGILIRMGKGKGKIIENYKFLEKNKIILILALPKKYNFEKLYFLLQLLNKINNKYLFLSQFEIID